MTSFAMALGAIPLHGIVPENQGSPESAESMLMALAALKKS
jgi:hypothetical protein